MRVFSYSVATDAKGFSFLFFFYSSKGKVFTPAALDF